MISLLVANEQETVQTESSWKHDGDVVYGPRLVFLDEVKVFWKDPPKKVIVL